MDYSDEYIANLISCRKMIVIPPQKSYVRDGGHYKKNFTLQSEDGNFLFRAFIRYNRQLCASFGATLIWKRDLI